MLTLATAAIFSCAEVQRAIETMYDTPWLTPVQRQEIVVELLAVSEYGCEYAPNGVAADFS
jgi:hypothetical protein